MKLKIIDTKGINHISPLEGTAEWYWGTDYAAGDLYEAEELYVNQYPLKSNRIVFVRMSEGTVHEPFKAKDGQYIGNTVFCQGKIYFLAVDFKHRKIEIHECSEKMDNTAMAVAIDLDEVRDCYNLMLATEPLMLIRQGHENIFEIIWPEHTAFEIGNTETFCFREDDRLVFSRWHEDPDYREEVIIRQYPSGDIIEYIDGAITEMPDGQKWILK